MRLIGSASVFFGFGARNSKKLGNLDRCRGIIAFCNTEQDWLLSEMNEENCNLYHSDDSWHTVDNSPVLVCPVKFGVRRQESS